MSAPSIAFVWEPSSPASSMSVFPRAMRALADAGVVVDVIAGKGRLIDLRTVRREHDLYVLKQISGVSLSMAGALHAEGAAIVNSYPVTMALRDKVVAARILAGAGDRKSTRLNSSHGYISYSVFCFEK